ncbi:MAG: hypothetical protein R3B58_08035 [Phycisphaerales bacterium]
MERLSLTIELAGKRTRSNFFAQQNVVGSADRIPCGLLVSRSN